VHAEYLFIYSFCLHIESSICVCFLCFVITITDVVIISDVVCVIWLSSWKLELVS